MRLGILKDLKIVALALIPYIFPLASFSQESFYIPSHFQEKLGLQSYHGFLLLENYEERLNSQYAVISNFKGSFIESQALIGITSIESARNFLTENSTTHSYRDVAMNELKIPLPNEGQASFFWVGHQSFSTLQEAQDAVDQALAEGITLKEAEEIPVEVVAPEESTGITISETIPESPESAPSAPEEESHYPWKLNQKIKRSDIPGTKVEPERSRFNYQIFGEWSWRRTNFDAPNKSQFNLNTDYFNDFVGFQTFRLMMKGLHFTPTGPTIDPFIEGTVSLASNANPFESKLVSSLGLEYRPLESVSALKKSPWLNWLPNLRLFGQYLDLYYLRETDTGAVTYDYRFGMGLYKDWGWSKPFDEQSRSMLSDYLWGELYMENVWKKTDFNSADYDSFTWTDAGWIGVKFPWIGEVPPLMPYVRLEITASQRDFFFQNKSVVGFGARYMPFHTKQFEKHEWLYNFKIFAEYDHIIDYLKDDRDADQPDWDFRAGIKIDVNRF